jgi:hypothetical protein
MRDPVIRTDMSRRQAMSAIGGTVAAVVVLPSFGRAAVFGAEAGSAGTGTVRLTAVAGPDRVVVQPGRTWINAWAGNGEPPRRVRRRRGEAAQAPPEPVTLSGVQWTKESGPGTVRFADAGTLVTTAAFSAPGEYVLRLTARSGGEEATSTFRVTVETGPPETVMEPVDVSRYRIDSRLWNHRLKSLIVGWIPHCIEQLERTDTERGAGGMDNFDEAAKALAGQPHGEHKGYVFSNSYVCNAVEAMCIAQMYDAQGDAEIIAAQAMIRDKLENWIPRILAAQYPDGYLQTAFTMRDPARWPDRWTPEGRSNHEGYVAGYFLEAAIAHWRMTEGRDTRLFDAARKMADLWYDNIGPPPKQEWWDGHQAMEMALVRFGRFINEIEGNGRGEKYIELAKFLLDCRSEGTEYDQSHLPVVQQYEAVGHAVRAVYNYTSMTDIALEMRDVDYISAIRSIEDNIVHRKYYVTGGVGSGETSEGFGPDYSLRNGAYCESCSSCGQIFYMSRMNRLYGDARYADLYEETLYNALLGATDLEGTAFHYTNPLDGRARRTAWHSVPCCPSNISRTLLSLPMWMYARSADAIQVNLFVGSTVTVPGVAGTDVEMVQETDHPWDGRVAITVNPAESRSFTVRIRVPARDPSALYTSAPDANGLGSLRLNGSAISPPTERGYAVITRTWQAGDRIEFEVPMRVQRVYADERIEEDRGRVALRRGPLVYNIEQADQDITQVLPPNAQLATEWRDDLLGGVLTITGTFADGSRMLAIPHYARQNRLPPPSEDPPRVEGERPPPNSIVWILEA